jgi:hypothetical protein
MVVKKNMKPITTTINYHQLNVDEDRKLKAFIIITLNFVYESKLESGNSELLLPQLCRAFHTEFKNLSFVKRWKCGEVVGDKGLRSLPATLTSLDLCGCRQVTDEGLRSLPATLRSLNMTWCKQVTNEGLRSLPATLASLNLGGCHQVTDEGLRALPTTLTSLRLRFCRVTDEGLQSLPATLTSLNLSWCCQVTDKGLRALPATLTSLNLWRCDKVSLQRNLYVFDPFPLVKICY